MWGDLIPNIDSPQHRLYFLRSTISTTHLDVGRAIIFMAVSHFPIFPSFFSQLAHLL